MAPRRFDRKTHRFDFKAPESWAKTPSMSGNSIDRRALVAGLAGVWDASVAGVAAPRTPTVALLGDSITSGYGLASPAQSLPVQLQAALLRSGVNARVVGAGVAGDTTSGGLARLERGVLPRAADVWVVALGANDMLNGVAPGRVKSNLLAIVHRLKARRATVILAGMRAAPLLDPRYVSAFDAVFPAVAREEGVALYPFLLDGVAFNPRLNQPDRIHPNAEGVRVIAARLAPTVALAIRRL